MLYFGPTLTCCHLDQVKGHEPPRTVADTPGRVVAAEKRTQIVRNWLYDYSDNNWWYFNIITYLNMDHVSFGAYSLSRPVYYYKIGV